MKRRKDHGDGRAKYMPTPAEIAAAAKQIRESNERGEGRRVYKMRDAELRTVKETTGLERI